MNPGALMILIVVGLLVFAGFVAFALFYLLRYNTPELSPAQQRLVKFKDLGNSEAEAYREKYRDLSSLFKGSLYENESLGALLEKVSLFRQVKKLLVQAGLTNPVDKFILHYLVAPVAICGFLGLVTGVLPILLVGLVIPGVAIGYLLFKRKKRFDKLVQQLPDALNIMTSALRAGHSFQAALSIVVTELPKPISQELSQVVNDLNLGYPLKDSLTKLINNLETLPDYQMLSTAILIQRETGGNLAEVLDQLGTTIRERFKLKRQVAALTGQAQLTGMVLGAAPFAMLLLLSLFFYGYVAPLYEHPLGHAALVVAFVMQTIGFIVIKKILTIKL